MIRPTAQLSMVAAITLLTLVLAGCEGGRIATDPVPARDTTADPYAEARALFEQRQNRLAQAAAVGS